MPRLCEHVDLCIEGNYVDDYNIHNLDKKIRGAIETEIKIAVPFIIDKIREIRRELKKPKLTAAKRNILEKEKSDLKERYTYLKSRKIMKDYLLNTQDIVKQYSPKKAQIRVFGEEETQNEEWAVKVKRMKLITEYLQIADKYIFVNITREETQSNLVCCVNCCEDLRCVEIGAKSARVCPKCFAENPILMEPSHTSYNEYKGISDVEEVESLDNFIRAMNRWDGSCPGDIPDDLYDRLDAYFESIGFPSRDVVRKSKKVFRFRGESNPVILRRALDSIGSKNHHDVNTIGHRYWGWDLPDLSHFRERIINDYKETQRVFSNLPIEERQRKSSPGTQFRMYKHFKMAGYECYEYEFKIPENDKSRRNQERLFKIMCDRCNNPDIVYIED